MLFAAMGISLGTLTGIAVAFATVPVGAQSASVDQPAASTTSANPSVSQSSVARTPDTKAAASQNAPSALNPDAKPAASNEVAENSSEPQADSAQSKEDQAASGGPTSNLPAKTVRAPSELAPAPPSATDKENPLHRPAPAHRRRSKSLAHPFANPAQTDSASDLGATPALSIQQLSFGDDSVASSFVSEGDVTVADYNPAAGTIETSDGRTFALGTTVGSNTASSWEDYRSNVHFRCGQNGNCMLMRHGVVAPNARLIDPGRSEDSALI
jgi:hypothetical protein